MEEKQIKHWLKENWFRLVIAIAIISIGLSLFYYLVIFTSQKEQNRLNQETQKQLLQEQEKQQKEVQIQKQAQITAENKYWDDWKYSIQDLINSGTKLSSDAETDKRAFSKYLEGLYLIKSKTPQQDAGFYALTGLVKAYENYIETLQNFIDSLNKSQSISYEMLLATENRDRPALDALKMRLNDNQNSVMYWGGVKEKEFKDAEALRTKIIKNSQ
ncbi:MAG: hypothetical protein HYV67_02470 [Candidatus Taylorbacteria bacterium]|nr:hypothetical protein [Candidatus Taylorbacteria bacterium]